MTPAFKGNHSAEELASLLDGEVTDMQRAEQLKAAMESDSALKAEFDDQRNIKLLLAQLADFDAPPYMATRIMGEIGARRTAQRRSFVPKWSAALGAIALFALGYGTAMQLATPNGAPVNTSVANVVPDGGGAYPPGLFRNTTQDFSAVPAAFEGDPYQDVYDEYAYYTGSSEELALPADADPMLKQFIELGQQAHTYSKTMRLNHSLVSPEMSSAVLVMDSGN
jgi:hypothetical protein